MSKQDWIVYRWAKRYYGDAGSSWHHDRDYYYREYRKCGGR